jgi:hypothetical protein
MILLRILFWFIVFYSLFKLLIRVVLPLLIKNTLQAKMKDMQENRGTFDDKEHTTDTASQPPLKKEKNTSSKGDYIDFEEVK